MLRQMVKGVRYVHSLGPVPLKVAEAEAALFKRDPGAYIAKAAPQVTPTASSPGLDVELVRGYLAHLQGLGRNADYIDDQKARLAWWAARERIGSRPFSSVPPQEVARTEAQLERGKRGKLGTLKAYASWLTDTGQLLADHDPTRGLSAGQSQPERSVKQKGYDPDWTDSLYRNLDSQVARDILRLMAMTGCHYTEVSRLASGEAAVAQVKHPVIAGTISFAHKKGTPHIVSVTQETYRAAKRLLETGGIPVLAASHPDRCRSKPGGQGQGKAWSTWSTKGTAPG